MDAWMDRQIGWSAGWSVSLLAGPSICLSVSPLVSSSFRWLVSPLVGQCFGPLVGQQVGRQAGRQAGSQVARQLARQLGSQVGRQAGRQADRQVGKNSQWVSASAATFHLPFSLPQFEYDLRLFFKSEDTETTNLTRNFFADHFMYSV